MKKKSDNIKKAFQELVEENKDQFENIYAFGAPLTELSKDELMTMVILANKEYLREQGRFSSNVDFLTAIIKAK